MIDLRIDLMLRIQNELHQVRVAASEQAPQGERWTCRCGADYRGKGSIERGRRHVAQEVLLALDEAARVP